MPRPCFHPLLILPLLLVLHGCTTPPVDAPATADPAPAPVAGQYRTMSESEWSIDLDLHPGGTAVIRSSSWLAGESASAETEVRRGHWSRDGSTVTVRVDGHVEILRYDENLSFGAFGQSGGGPGLSALAVGRAPGDTLLGQNHFWRVGVLTDL